MTFQTNSVAVQIHIKKMNLGINAHNIVRYEQTKNMERISS